MTGLAWNSENEDIAAAYTITGSSYPSSCFNGRRSVLALLDSNSKFNLKLFFIGRVKWARTSVIGGSTNVNTLEIIVNPIFFNFMTDVSGPTYTTYLFAIASTQTLAQTFVSGNTIFPVQLAMLYGPHLIISKLQLSDGVTQGEL